MIYESHDGGRTVYSHEPGDSASVRYQIDDLISRESKLTTRWFKLKKAVFLEDPVINDLIQKIEIIMELKK